MSFRIRSLAERKKERHTGRLCRLASPLRERRILGIALLLVRPLFALGRRIIARVQKRKQEAHIQRVLALSVATIVAGSIVLLTLSLLLRVGSITVTTLLEGAGAPIATDEEGSTNVLLLGQGNDDHEGIDLTDTIIVASIDPLETQSVVLLSLPRDLYFLHTEALALGKGKLNALWRDERLLLQQQGQEEAEASRLALEHLKADIGTALGIPIHYVVKVDFTAFEEVIDALGGVEMVVQETIHDTEFPGPNYSYETFHIDAGLQTLDGATALKYARTRATSSDFERSHRQQQILQAAAKKVRETGFLRQPQKIVPLLANLREHIETDLSIGQLLTLGKMARKLPEEHILSLQLNDRNGLYDAPLEPGGLLYAPPRDLFGGASVLLPVSIPEFPVTWTQIQTLSTILFRHRELLLLHPRFTILNGGAPEGSARRLSRELMKFGFDVLEVANVPGQRKFDHSRMHRSTLVFDQKAANTLASLLRLPFEPTNEEWESLLAGVGLGDLTIILGKDYRFTHFQELLPLTTDF
jgi:LCP family protein required for cell wall assembly